MSHQPERTEKNCLNCGTTVIGRYCHVCGQENIVPKQNFFSLTKHFIYDVFHFDGKFFDTLRKLFFKPGQVAKEFTAGRRHSLLDPIRMYLFTSTIFFIIFFSLLKPPGIVKGDFDALSLNDRKELIDSFSKQIQRGGVDTILFRNYISVLEDTTKRVTINDVGGNTQLFGSSKQEETVARYDSIQKAKPKAERDGWFSRLIKRKIIQISQKYKGRSGEGLKAFENTLLHLFPYMLFLSLPFFAGTLKLLYIRRKNFYYSDHAVFTLYHYVFAFIVLFFILVCSKLRDLSDMSFFGWLIAALSIWWLIYLYLGMKRYYGQGSIKTFIKFLLQSFLNFIIIFLLLFIFLILSIFQL